MRIGHEGFWFLNVALYGAIHGHFIVYFSVRGTKLPHIYRWSRWWQSSLVRFVLGGGGNDHVCNYTIHRFGRVLAVERRGWRLRITWTLHGVSRILSHVLVLVSEVLKMVTRQVCVIVDHGECLLAVIFGPLSEARHRVHLLIVVAFIVFFVFCSIIVLEELIPLILSEIH